MTYIMLPVDHDTIPVTPVDDYRYTTLASCVLHRDHVPATHINEIHHVWPKGDGGPDIPENRIVVCATGHNNIHKLINEFKSYEGRVPYTVLRTYSFEERRYAKLGWARGVRRFM